MSKTIFHATPSNIKTNKDVIDLLYQYNISFILIGSEAGAIYELCDSKKDIDFLIDPRQSNLLRIFKFLQQYFDYNDFDKFQLLDSIILRTGDKKYIELLKNPELLPSYDYLIKNAKSYVYFDHQTLIINKSDYIDYVKRGVVQFTNSTPNSKNNYHLLKFEQVLQNFKCK